MNRPDATPKAAHLLSLLIVLVALFALTGCVDGAPGAPTKFDEDSVTNPGPMGPPVMTMRVTNVTATDATVIFGGLIKTGLVTQPREDSSLTSLEILDYCTTPMTQRFVPTNNGQWELNADVSVIRNVRHCNGKLVFELVAEAKNLPDAPRLYDRIAHTFNPVQFLPTVQHYNYTISSGTFGPRITIDLPS